MRFRVIVMPVAEGDIAGIIRYIADVLGNKNAALEHYDAFCRALESLEEMPDRNPISRLEVLNERGIRLIPVGNYVKCTAFLRTKVSSRSTGSCTAGWISRGRCDGRRIPAG